MANLPPCSSSFEPETEPTKRNEDSIGAPPPPEAGVVPGFCSCALTGARTHMKRRNGMIFMLTK
jgi:hypothetical protein